MNRSGFTKTVCGAAALMLASPAMSAAAADRYPSKPIRIIAPAAPGSGADIISRLIGGKLTEAWGQQVVVDNRSGAAGNIGSEIAAKAAPDGYTLLMASSQQIIAPLLFEKPPYHLLRDFSPVVLMGSTPNVLSVHPSVAATSVKELIALAKAKPGTLRYGSSGTGGTQHLAAEMFATMADIKLVHVPYKSTVFALVDAMGGQVHFVISALPVTLPMIRQGKLRPLGVSSLKRTPLAPELETIAETVPGYETLSWWGLVAPIRTPQWIIARLNAEINQALKSAEIREKMHALGAEPLGTTPQEFASFMASQTEKIRKLIAIAGMRPN